MIQNSLTTLSRQLIFYKNNFSQMARRVFFSFHYQDVIDFRANVVRQHWITKPDRQDAGFFDASVWETAMKTSDLALKRLINGALARTTGTCVLIGSNTYKRRWVKYEIFKSLERGNGLLGVHINKIKGKNQQTKSHGENPFEWLGLKVSADGKTVTPVEHDGWFSWNNSTDVAAFTLANPMAYRFWGKTVKLSDLFPVYCWIDHDGYNNFSNWVN